MMRTLIDGHNLIGQIESLRLSDHDDEAQLVMILRGYAARKRGRKVVVIFDCGIYGHPDHLNGYGVECHFAKDPGDADKELIRHIRAIRRPDAWQVVTSDRAVAGEARARGINVIPSQKFAQTLFKRPIPKVTSEDTYKEQTLSPREVDEWLRLFGIDPTQEEEEE